MSREIGFLVLSYFLILAPSSTIVPLHLAFEHRVYLSLAALIIGVVLVLYWAARRILTRGREGDGRAISVVVGLSLSVAIGLGWLTHQRNKVYHDRVTMWRDVVRVSPHNSRGHMNLAKYLADRGELEQADRHYQFGLKLDPDFSLLQYEYSYFLAYRRDDLGRGIATYSACGSAGADTIGFLADAGQRSGGIGAI